MKTYQPAQRLLLPLFFSALILIYGSSASAGDLQPTAPPAPTMYSLGEIYEKIDSLSTGSLNIPAQTLFSGSTGINATIELNGGLIEGSCTIPEREGTITVIGLSHDISQAYDPASGMLSGNRVHQPVKIIKYFDKATPPLHTALTARENIALVTIKFYRTDGSGAEVHYYTLQLEDAKVITIESSAPNIETISLIYKKIRWIFEETGTISEDTWGIPQI